MFLLDDLSFGRIDYEYALRYDYLKILANNDEKCLKSCFNNNMQFIQELKDNRDCDCVVWYSNRSYEYCFMMFCVNYIQNKTAQVYGLNISQELEGNDNLLCTRDLDPEDIVKHKQKLKLIPLEVKTETYYRWNKFAIEKSLLRVFENNTVISLNSAYYDSDIFDSIMHCKYSHEPISSYFFRKHGDIVTDGFFNWRLHTLVENKNLTFKNGSYDV